MDNSDVIVGTYTTEDDTLHIKQISYINNNKSSYICAETTRMQVTKK